MEQAIRATISNILKAVDYDGDIPAFTEKLVSIVKLRTFDKLIGELPAADQAEIGSKIQLALQAGAENLADIHRELLSKIPKDRYRAIVKETIQQVFEEFLTVLYDSLDAEKKAAVQLLLQKTVKG